jgi:hypothetical protein
VGGCFFFSFFKDEFSFFFISTTVSLFYKFAQFALIFLVYSKSNQTFFILKPYLPCLASLTHFTASYKTQEKQEKNPPCIYIFSKNREKEESWINVNIIFLQCEYICIIDGGL